jgi:DNA repair exonuclease SbcCD ATPase subunit
MAEVTTNTASATTPAAPGSGTTSGPADPKAELDRLKALVQKNNDQIVQISTASTEVQQDIAVLESGLAEVNQIVSAYTRGTEAIKDLSSLKTFIDQKSNIAAAAIGSSGKAAVEAIVAQYDGDVTAQTKSVADLQAASAQATSAHDAALADANAKKAAYNTAKTTLSRIQAIHTDLQNLQKQVGSAANEGNLGAMCFLTDEMRSGLTALVTPSAADLQNQLSSALLDIKTALKAARDKKTALDEAQAAVTAAQKKLDSSKTNRRASLLESVKSVKAQPTPPSSPPTGQPASPATAAAQPAPASPAQLAQPPAT